MKKRKVVIAVVVFTLLFGFMGSMSVYAAEGPFIRLHRHSGVSVMGYLPKFGELNQRFDWWDNNFGLDTKFKGGFAYELRMGWDLTEKLALMIGVGKFVAKTKGHYVGYTKLRNSLVKETLELGGKLRVNPVVLYLNYNLAPRRVISPFIEAGVGLVETQLYLRKEYEWMEFSDYWWGKNELDFYLFEETDRDHQMIVKLRGGININLHRAYLTVGAGYTSAKAEMGKGLPDVDLSGGEVFAALVFELESQPRGDLGCSPEFV